MARQVKTIKIHAGLHLARRFAPQLSASQPVNCEVLSEDRETFQNVTIFRHLTTGNVSLHVLFIFCFFLIFHFYYCCFIAISHRGPHKNSQ